MKATPVPRRAVVKDQDRRDQSYHNVTTINLTVGWTPGHRDLRNATKYHDHGGGGGASPRVGYATPPSLPALRAHLVTKGQ